MLNRNVETFLACDREFDNADTVLFGAPLTPRLHSAREPASALVPSEGNLMGWKPTVLIWTWIWKICL